MNDWDKWKEFEKEITPIVVEHIESDPIHKGYLRVKLSSIGFKQKSGHEYVYCKGTKKRATEDITHMIYFEDEIIERLKK